MTTASIASTTKIHPTPGSRDRSRVFKPPPLAPGLSVSRSLRPIVAVQARSSRWRATLQTAASFSQDVALATLVTLLFMSPFLYVFVSLFTWQWTVGVAIGVTILTCIARFRMSD